MTKELRQSLVEQELYQHFNPYSANIGAGNQTAKGVTETMRSRTAMRMIGFLLLVVLGLALTLIFFLPDLLMGIVGLLYPIGLFAILLLAFYLILLSIRSEQ